MILIEREEKKVIFSSYIPYLFYFLVFLFCLLKVYIKKNYKKIAVRKSKRAV